ncbi:MAG: tetratricopeptide repeat protein [Sedimentisphaerales bacterium]|nr:tetratricopeptide repeat protein [Sedimentisphaerales bacterium]
MYKSRPAKGFRWILLAAGFAGLLAAGGIRAAETLEYPQARDLYRTGRYEESLDQARRAVEQFRYSRDWRILLLESLLAVGRYDQAQEAFDEIILRFPTSMQLLRLGETIYRQNGQAEKAGQILERMRRYGRMANVSYWDSADIVALGEALLRLGADPRAVLEGFFQEILRSDPDCRPGYLAAGNLALEKYDYELAGETFQEALKRFADDPDMHYGLARAFYHSDRGVMIKSLDAALTLNANHVPSLLLRTEHLIDAEDLPAAGKMLDRILAVNPARPEAWAFRALLAHLDNDPNAAEDYRGRAFKSWPANPQVDYLIGQKLSQKYRFAEGARYQRQALQMDPGYVPAQIQLAQDLLRLGDEQAGWQLARQVHQKDGYNVEAYNLVTLADAMAKFHTRQNDAFVVRMDPTEAEVYGDMVLELLAEAKTVLCEKYHLSLDRPVMVELFPQQQDFAVRTFGLPGGDGFLGVCFGSVITMNSPRPERPANWQAVLWHEFGHVVSLHLTQNRMPRWLSEGISVYEESQRNPTWGQRMIPEYRRMILAGQLTPIGELSGAFLNPPTPLHLQFAYYESSLVVEYLVGEYGLEALRAVLADLAEGEPVNAVLARHTDRLERLEEGFAGFARRRAEELAPKMDWQLPDDIAGAAADPGAVEMAGPSPVEWLEGHPDSFWALSAFARELMRQGEFQKAKEPLGRLIELYPDHVGQDNPYELLAAAHRELGETDQEYAILEVLAGRSADALAAYERLVALAEKRQDWQTLIQNARRYRAVNPLLAKVHTLLGRALELQGERREAVRSYQRSLVLDPVDPVEIHYRLARLLRESEPAAAKTHVLLALADAPRYRAAQRLLLELVNRGQNETGPDAAASKSPAPPAREIP